MSLNEIKEWAEFLWPFISPIAALLCTFTLVSFFKSILKHYRSSQWDKFTVVMLTRVIAFITGYTMAYFFLSHLEGTGKWAFALAVLNIPLYSALLKYATSKQWLTVIAILKGRRLVVRQENGETVEKVMDEDDRTMIKRITDKND